MSSIVLMIFPISPELRRISVIADSDSCIFWLLSTISRPTVTAFSLTFRACSALLCTCSKMSEAVAASS